MKLLVILMALISTSVFSGEKFSSLLNLHESKDFFRFIDHSSAEGLEESENLYVKCLVENLKNNNKESNVLITEFFDKYKASVHDSLLMKLYEIRMKNSVNMFDYKDARICAEDVLKNFAPLLDSEETDDMKNSLVIWQAAENLQKQTVEVTGDSRIKASRDMAGLINIPVKCGGVEEDFIFDTGANFSVVNDTYAKKMKLVMLPGNIKVGSVTGKKVDSKLAYAELLEIGSMKFKNVVFLVLPDETLSFAGGMYVINGIIGFPVIKEMLEIHIKEKEIFVPKDKSSNSMGNLLIDGFIPVIEVIDGKDSLAFTFDTGAKKTMLYSTYYERNKVDIDKNYSKEEIEFGGAGGTLKVMGFRLESRVFKIGTSKYKLEDLRLLAERIKDHDKSYSGNLGQDYMGEFSEMILNFDDMYVDFKK